jgi:hypothetical protein
MNIIRVGMLGGKKEGPLTSAVAFECHVEGIGGVGGIGNRVFMPSLELVCYVLCVCGTICAYWRACWYGTRVPKGT